MARLRKLSSGSELVGVENLPDLAADIKQLQKGIALLPEKVGKRAVTSAVTRATKGFKAEVAAKTPRGKTGNLLAGLGHKTTHGSKRNSGGFFKVRIGFNRGTAPHAILVEDGTKPRYTKSGLFVGAYRGRMPKSDFFKNLIRQKAPAISQEMVTELQKGFLRLAKKYLPNT